jgi:hypothetical protein
MLILATSCYLSHAEHGGLAERYLILFGRPWRFLSRVWGRSAAVRFNRALRPLTKSNAISRTHQPMVPQTLAYRICYCFSSSSGWACSRTVSGAEDRTFDPKLPVQQHVVRWIKNRALVFILGTLSAEADRHLRTNCSIWASMGFRCGEKLQLRRRK